MNIHAANQTDLTSLMTITRRCIEHLNKQQIYQWDESYPSKQDFYDDIRERTLYIIDTPDRIAGCICINEVEYPGYERAKWLGSSFFVTHKMIIDPTFEDQGFGKFAMKFVEEFARAERKDSIRLDCYKQNLRANVFYQNLGYIIRGEAVFRNRIFFLYEKMI